MAELRKNGPYIWVTCLTRLLVGENSCEWAAWFRAQHESWSWERVSSGFDLVAWQMAHTSGINENRRGWEELVSRAPRNWATGAAESCTTDVMTDGSKSGRVAALLE